MNHLYIKETDTKKNIHTAYDFEGNIKYYIHGRWGRIDDIVVIYDNHASLIYQAKQTVLSLFPRFALTTNEGDHIADIAKHKNFFYPSDPYYSVSGFKWKITSKYNGTDFTISSHSDKIGTIQKHLTHTKKVYTLSLDTEYDLALASLLTVLLDHYEESPETKTETLRFISINGQHYIQLPGSDYFSVSPKH